ncbi:MAG: Uma2 family endonuclease [Phormidesmis sp.]
MATLQVSQIEIAPGDRLKISSVNWHQFKDIAEELGAHRTARVAYDNGKLEIMVPLPGHEDDKEILSDLIKALLEELDTEFRALGSTTFEQQSTLKGIEPDQCFYIKHEATIRGKRRLNITTDPPPDLVLEIDTTARTHVETYAALGVPELWRFSPKGLSMHVLYAGSYKEVKESPLFPNLPLKEVIPYCLEQSRTLGRNTVMRDFRLWVKKQPKA